MILYYTVKLYHSQRQPVLNRIQKLKAHNDTFGQIQKTNITKIGGKYITLIIINNNNG